MTPSLYGEPESLAEGVFPPQPLDLGAFQSGGFAGEPGGVDRRTSLAELLALMGKAAPPPEKKPEQRGTAPGQPAPGFGDVRSQMRDPMGYDLGDVSGAANWGGAVDPRNSAPAIPDLNF